MSAEVPLADQNRLREVARLMAEARTKADEAAALLMEGMADMTSEPSTRNAYATEWSRLTNWIDAAPVAAWHYTCQGEWTGGSLSDPGTQNVVRWPVSFGASSSHVVL
jgi:hypothetical protein